MIETTIMVLYFCDGLNSERNTALLYQYNTCPPTDGLCSGVGLIYCLGGLRAAEDYCNQI